MCKDLTRPSVEPKNLPNNLSISILRTANALDSRHTRPHYLFITHTHTLQSAHHNTAPLGRLSRNNLPPVLHITTEFLLNLSLSSELTEVSVKANLIIVLVQDTEAF